MKIEFLSYLKLRIPNIDNFELCYVEDGTAFFTNDFDKQWGDDWDDAPYEHNAGFPYSHNGTEILKLKFEGEFEEPCDGHSNSPYSVERINKDGVAWLTKVTYFEDNTPAGPIWNSEEVSLVLPRTKVLDFIERINNEGGQIYIPMEMEI